MSTFENTAIPQSGTTRVFYRDSTVKSQQIVSEYQELEFVKWTTKFLVVKFPPESLEAGKPWKMGRKLVEYWTKLGVLKIEGEIPQMALVE